jgi:hypothetical protein
VYSAGSGYGVIIQYWEGCKQTQGSLKNRAFLDKSSNFHLSKKVWNLLRS